MADIFTELMIALKLDTTEFQRGREEAEREVDRLREAARAQGATIENAGNKAADAFRRLRNETLAYFAILMGANSVRDFTAQIIRSNDELGRFARNLGLRTEDVSQWQNVAERVGGSAQGMAQALSTLVSTFEQQRITGASSPLLAGLRTLLGGEGGITDALGNLRSINELIPDIIEELNKMPRSQAAQWLKTLGLEGLTPLLGQTRSEIEGLLAEQQKIGVTTQRDVEAARRLQQQWSTLRQQIRRTGETIITAVEPALTQAMTNLNTWLMSAEGQQFRADLAAAATKFAEALRDVDWNSVAESLRQIWRLVDSIVQLLGGWERAAGVVIGLFVASKIAGMLAGLASIVSGITGVTTALVPGVTTAAATAGESITGLGSIQPATTGITAFANAAVAIISLKLGQHIDQTLRDSWALFEQTLAGQEAAARERAAGFIPTAEVRQKGIVGQVSATGANIIHYLQNLERREGESEEDYRRRILLGPGFVRTDPDEIAAQRDPNLRWNVPEPSAEPEPEGTPQEQRPGFLRRMGRSIFGSPYRRDRDGAPEASPPAVTPPAPPPIDEMTVVAERPLPVLVTNPQQGMVSAAPRETVEALGGVTPTPPTGAPREAVSAEPLTPLQALRDLAGMVSSPGGAAEAMTSSPQAAAEPTEKKPGLLGRARNMFRGKATRAATQLGAPEAYPTGGGWQEEANVGPRIAGLPGGPIGAAGGGMFAKMGRSIGQAFAGGGGDVGEVGQAPEGLVPGVQWAAEQLGIPAEDLLTAISYETGGKLDPNIRGPTTKWGTHRGLIQFGEPQAQRFLNKNPDGSVDWSVESQMAGIVRYMRAHGHKPGMSYEQTYATINAGNPNKVHASDVAAGGAPGTVREKVQSRQMQAHRARAQRHLEAQGGGQPQVQPAVLRRYIDQGGPQDMNAVNGGGIGTDPSLLGAANVPMRTGTTTTNNNGGNTINISAVNIQTQATDAEGIAKGIGPALQKYANNVANANTGLV